MVKVRDVMVTQIYSVEPTTTLEAVAWELKQRGISGAPVIGDDHKLVGVISKTDLADPEPQEWLKKNATVEEIMNAQVFSIDQNAPLLDAIKELAKHRIHRLVVVDDAHRLVGILTNSDIIMALARGVRLEG